MKVFLLISIYIVFNFYIVRKIYLWFSALSSKKVLKLVRDFVILLYVISSSSVIFGYILKVNNVQKFIQKFSNYFVGFLFYMLFFGLISEILKFLTIKIFKYSKEFYKCKKYLFSISICAIAFISIFSFYGFYHADDIKVKNYYTSVNKKVDGISNLKIALVSDLHLGYSVGYDMIYDMVDKINKENVDLVIIAGDIFDNSYDAVDDIDKVKSSLKSINSKYGVYATFGNHDVSERLFAGFSMQNSKKSFRDSRMKSMLLECNIKILEDEVYFGNDFYIIGRKDYEKAGDGTRNRKSIDELLTGVNQDKFIILIDHEPRDLINLSKKNIDLTLSGHTHAGQFFPLNLGLPFIWDNPYGLKEYGNMTSLVTSGIGVYGPNIRVLSDSEISILNVNLNK